MMGPHQERPGAKRKSRLMLRISPLLPSPSSFPLSLLVPLSPHLPLPSAHTQERPCEDIARRWPICRPGRESPPRTRPHCTLTPGFQAPDP